MSRGRAAATVLPMPQGPNHWPRAVLFDFDGTLIDGYPAIAASVNHVRSLHELPPLSVEEVDKAAFEQVVRAKVPLGDFGYKQEDYDRIRAVQ